jgi:ferrochelatase
MPIDVLMLQLGTPDAPTAKALRPYLRQFLTDPRVIEMNPAARWLLVNLLIVPTRAAKSAAKYRRIWNDATGSPLLEITRRQRDRLGEALGPDFRVWFAMRYGNPSTPKVVEELWGAGCERLVVLPMYPQYSATTTASALDALFEAVRRRRTLPALRIVSDFHLDEGYLDAVVRSIRRRDEQARSAGAEPEMRLLSFHGVPIDYIKRGDPYMRQCAETGKSIAKRMGWTKGEWRLTFQSRLGRQKWLTPYTDETLKELGRMGLKTVLVAQPGFTTDCLETIDEIGREGTEEFRSTGGENLIRVPCLNDDPDFILALKGIVEREACGWRS